MNEARNAEASEAQRTVKEHLRHTLRDAQAERGGGVCSPLQRLTAVANRRHGIMEVVERRQNKGDEDAQEEDVGHAEAKKSESYRLQSLHRLRICSHRTLPRGQGDAHQG